MFDEKEILLDIYKISYQLLEIKLNMNKIEDNINLLNNDYFIKNNIYPELLNIVDKISFKELTNYKNIIEEKLNNICVHEWINDYIDIGPDLSQQICYCKLCEITKKI